jgi:hypothetical protein
MGVFNVDIKARDSLACDLMDPVRPKGDGFLLDWIMKEPRKREWLLEQPDGNCRLGAEFTAQSSEIAPMWGPAVAPFAEWGGKTIHSGRGNCVNCAVNAATENMLHAGRIGRQKANGPEAQQKRAKTQRKNAVAQHAWKSSDQPVGLTDTFYSEKVQPVIASMSASAIARQISVSRWPRP